MEAHYITVYKLLGVKKLPPDAETSDLVALPYINGNVKLTTNPDPYCFDIDRWTAIAVQLFKGLFVPKQNSTPQERLAAQIERVRRDRVDRFGTGVFLVFEGVTDIASQDFKMRHDLEDVAICFDSISKEELRATFMPAVYGVLTAMVLGIR